MRLCLDNLIIFCLKLIQEFKIIKKYLEFIQGSIFNMINSSIFKSYM